MCSSACCELIKSLCLSGFKDVTKTPKTDISYWNIAAECRPVCFSQHNRPLCCKSSETIAAQTASCVGLAGWLKPWARTLLSNHLIHRANRLVLHGHPEGLLPGLHITLCLLWCFCSCLSLNPVNSSSAKLLSVSPKCWKRGRSTCSRFPTRHRSFTLLRKTQKQWNHSWMLLRFRLFPRWEQNNFN